MFYDYSQKIKRVRLGVKLCLDLRFFYVVDQKFSGIVKVLWLGECSARQARGDPQVKCLNWDPPC